MGNHIEIDVLPNNLHASENIGGNRTDNDTVVILIKRLNLHHIFFYLLVLLHTEICQEDGLLYTVASHTPKVFSTISIGYSMFLRLILAKLYKRELRQFCPVISIGSLPFGGRCHTANAQLLKQLDYHKS